MTTKQDQIEIVDLEQHLEPSLYCVSTFLVFFWPTHLTYVSINSTERQQKNTFFWSHPPNPFADVM